MNKNDAIDELLTRRIGLTDGRRDVQPSLDEIKKRLSAGKNLRVYLGIDPTGPDLHLGHTIPLLFLKQLLDLGHQPVLLIGDFTATIGDPTGKEVTREPLSKEQVAHNMKKYLDQVYKILPKGSFEVVYNSSWLSKFSIDKFFQLLSNVTVQQLIARSMFRERMDKKSPLAVHEFLYPVMVGYDSVALEIDGEVGGIDQWFNMGIGRDLEKKLLNKDKMVFATRLLVDAESGKKMSKTEGGLISLSDSPNDMFRKVMESIPDEMIVTVFELCTEKDTKWIKDNLSRTKKDPLAFKKDLANELVTMYHFQSAAKEARAEWERVVSKKEKPSQIEEMKVKARNIVDVLVETKLAASKSEAKRLIEQKGVKVDDQVASEETQAGSGSLIQVGKRKFIKIK